MHSGWNAFLCNVGLWCSVAQAQTSEDERKALLETKTRDEQGYALARNDWGDSYSTYEGMEKNYVEAVEWYRRARKKGLEFKDAIKILNRPLASGLDDANFGCGVRRDDERRYDKETKLNYRTNPRGVQAEAIQHSSPTFGNWNLLLGDIRRK